MVSSFEQFFDAGVEYQKWVESAIIQLRKRSSHLDFWKGFSGDKFQLQLIAERGKRLTGLRHSVHEVNHRVRTKGGLFGVVIGYHDISNLLHYIIRLDEGVELSNKRAVVSTVVVHPDEVVRA